MPAAILSAQEVAVDSLDSPQIVVTIESPRTLVKVLEQGQRCLEARLCEVVSSLVERHSAARVDGPGHSTFMPAHPEERGALLIQRISCFIIPFSPTDRRQPG